MTDKHPESSRPRFGVLSAWFGGDYQSELISGIELEAKRNNVDIFYFVGRSLNSPFPPDNNNNVIYDAALDASLDGLVVMPMLASYSSADEMSRFLSRFAPVPLITINFKTSHGNAILTNNTRGFRTLLEHLTDEHGYRKLAFINGPDMNYDAVERSEIFTSVLASRNIPLDPSLATNGTFSYLSGREAVCTFLDERRLVPGRDIEAIVCANDQMAWGALNEIEGRGFTVPRDVAITGFDDIHSTIFPIPSLTTVNQHVVAIGKSVISNLCAYEPGRKDLVFDTELVIRTSCGCSGSDGVHDRGKKTRGNAAGPHASESGTTAGPPGHRNDLVVLLYKIIAIQDTLKLILNTGELDAWLGQHLPALGIGSAFLFLYSELPGPSRTVRPVAGYDRKNKNRGDRERTLPVHSMFDEILPEDERRSYCVLPLLYERDQYGMLAVEVDVALSIVYDTLNSPIGNSIRSMLLMNEVSTMNLLLQKATEQKSQFFINVAHETKTPLTLIQNYLERSMERHASDLDLAIVKQNIDVLLENMLGFLDAERLEKGTMSFSHDSFIDLSDSVRKKCDLFRPVAARKDIAIELRAENDIVIQIDPWALDRILNNLLDNAVKYTQSGGKVTVEVRKSAGRTVLRVRDNGPGFTDDTIAHLFEPYYQLSRKRSSTQGIGVGLSIVKKIVDDLGATIAVGNIKGGGAGFTVSFERRTDAKKPRTLGDIPRTAPSAGILAGANPAEDGVTGGRPAILIVDDNVQMLNFLKSSLEKTYDVYLAKDVALALTKLKTIVRPDVIVSDIMMDGMDGHAFLAALTKEDEYCDIPFIFLTAASARDEELRGLSGGAIDYIKKPFSLHELEKKIESIVALRDRMKKREIRKIREGIDGILSALDGKAEHTPRTTFDSLCAGYGLSVRETNIVSLLLEGLLNKEIAFQLHLSQRAVEYHITNIFKKLGITKKFDLRFKFRI